MNNAIVIICGLLFFMLSTLFFHIYFSVEPKKRKWLSFWYGLCFEFASLYMFMYMLLKGVIK